MNNTQFRNLLVNNVTSSGKNKDATGTPSQRPSATSILGSRARSSIPMTPRSVAGYNSSNDFAGQLAEHKRELSGLPATRRFRSSAAPKGTKLASGYQDRTSLRRAEGDDAETEDDKEKRLKALEEMMKLQQIDQATFENLRAEIGVGGDVRSTHLVKGLDWKLLERVKRGEDVTSATPSGDAEAEEQLDEHVDDELEDALGQEVQAKQKEERVKKGEMAPPPSKGGTGGEKLSRNEILQRLKASRNNVQQRAPPPPPEPSLGDRFKKLGTGDKSEKKRFTEVVNGRRREVLLTIDKNGKTKRKVKWLDKEEPATPSPSTMDSSQEPLGMEVPAELAAKQQAILQQQQQAEDEDDDIFAGVGADYNPLADINDNSDDDTPSEGEDKSPRVETWEALSKPDDSKPKPRSYFATASTEQPEDRSNPFAKDPSILAALKRAAGLRTPLDATNNEALNTTAEDQDPERLLKRKQFLENLRKRDREDQEDMDLGFGESRFGDEEDEEVGPWDDDEGSKKGARKRGPKKRRGDKDNVSDVMSVLEGRNKPGTKK